MARKALRLRVASLPSLIEASIQLFTSIYEEARHYRKRVEYPYWLVAKHEIAEVGSMHSKRKDRLKQAAKAWGEINQWLTLYASESRCKTDYGKLAVRVGKWFKELHEYHPGPTQSGSYIRDHGEEVEVKLLTPETIMQHSGRRRFSPAHVMEVMHDFGYDLCDNLESFKQHFQEQLSSSDWFRATANFAIVHHRGKRIRLTPTQAEIVKYLHQASQTSQPYRKTSEIFRAIKAGSGRLRDQFRRNGDSGLWNTLIGSNRRGGYCLNLSSPELAPPK